MPDTPTKSTRSTALRRLATLLAIALLAAGAWALVPTEDAEAGDKDTDSKTTSDTVLVCPVLPTLMAQYLETHTVFDEYDDVVAERAVTAYVEGVDPNEVLLTEDEYLALVERVEATVTEVREGECDDLLALHKDLVSWHEDMAAFAKETLSDDDFELDEETTLQVDPDERERPTTEAEQEALRKKIIQLQLANYINAGIEMDEARDKLIKRYERIASQLDDLEPVDVYSRFMKRYAHGLDPHTTYFSAEDLEDFEIRMQLSLQGIGAVLSTEDGFTVVREIVPGGAADRHGVLKPEDKIIAVAQGPDAEPVPVIDMPLRDVVRLIRGEKGTKVKLTILRQGEKTKKRDLIITRDEIDLKQQAAKLEWQTREVDGESMKLAIIELPSFYGGGDRPRGSIEDVQKLLAEASEKGADGVLLDLSRNGGGLLQAAVEISGLFIDKGPVVGIDGRAIPKKILSDPNDGLVYDGPLVVLTSRISASASEILAGALQDYERAVVVGDAQTFGKGTVQQILPLPPGMGALKVTTGTFYLPEGESTQHRGVSADIHVPSVFDDPEIGERNQPNALPATTIDAFEGSDANPDDGGYARVTREIIEQLAERSAERVAANDEFKKVAESIEERKANNGHLRIGDLLEDHDDEDGADEDEKDADDEEPSPQAKEALNILADLAVAVR